MLTVHKLFIDCFDMNKDSYSLDTLSIDRTFDSCNLLKHNDINEIVSLLYNFTNSFHVICNDNSPDIHICKNITSSLERAYSLFLANDKSATTIFLEILLLSFFKQTKSKISLSSNESYLLEQSISISDYFSTVKFESSYSEKLVNFYI